MCNLLLGICFWREAPESAVGPDRRVGIRGLIARIPEGLRTPLVGQDKYDIGLGLLHVHFLARRDIRFGIRGTPYLIIVLRGCSAV